MIVTTFSPDGYEKYGKTFIETYRKYVTYPLVVYVEDDLELDGIDVRQLYDIPGCSEFLQRIKQYKPDHYRRDVNKFSRKVFAITDALNHDGAVTFLGADTVFLKAIPSGFFENLVKDRYISYLGRDNYHSETDYITFNTRHSVNQTFKALFKNIYVTGAFQHLRYWCDSDVFDFVREMLNVPSVDINKARDLKHPFVNSVLGEYMDHLKGPERKKLGRSLKSDYIDKRRA